MEIIRAKNLSCGYTGTTVLHNINFSTERGEILVLVGPNGSGKTTVLRALSGFIKPESGNIFLFKEDIGHLPAHKIARKVASVPQNIKVSWPFEVYQVVKLGRFPYRGWISAYKKSDITTVKNAMESTGVWDLRNRRINTLSGGEFQRVIIAKALAQTPDLLLLDEPVAHLDIKHKIDILDLIKEYAKKGITCILSLHDLNLAGLYADRILLLNEGEIFAAGSPTSVLTKTNIEKVYKTRVDVKKIDKNGNFFIIPAQSRKTIDDKKYENNIKMDNSFRFFSNKDCEYYPCHKGIKEIDCLFCFCPLYYFPDCGGYFTVTENSQKDCSECIIPHTPEGYDYILEKLKTLKLDKGNKQ